MKCRFIASLLIGCCAAMLGAAPMDYVTEEYNVPPTFQTWISRAGYKAPALPEHWREFFPPSGPPIDSPQATYVKASQRLIVRHTRAWHEIMRKLVEQWKRDESSGQPPDPELIKQLRAAAEAAIKALPPPKRAPDTRLGAYPEISYINATNVA